MGHPHPTVDLPGHHPALTALLDRVHADPFGVLDELRRGCRGGAVAAGHLCVTNWVTDPAAGVVLLVRHDRLGWATCGGHVGRDESVVAAAVRELREETGLEAWCTATPLPTPLFVHRTDAVGAGPGEEAGHAHWNVAFGWIADPGTPLVAEPGRPAAWFPVTALPAGGPDDLRTGVASLVAAVVARADDVGDAGPRSGAAAIEGGR